MLPNEKNRVVGALFIIGWNIVWTSIIMCFIKYGLRIPLRMTEAELLGGSDMVHGEAAYVFGPYEAHEQQLEAGLAEVGVAGKTLREDPHVATGPSEKGIGGVTLGLDPQVENGNSSSSQEVKMD
jgi:Amt family ammonium transporter